jgi:hypothetical protein
MAARPKASSRKANYKNVVTELAAMIKGGGVSNAEICDEIVDADKDHTDNEFRVIFAKMFGVRQPLYYHMAMNERFPFDVYRAPLGRRLDGIEISYAVWIAANYIDIAHKIAFYPSDHWFYYFGEKFEITDDKVCDAELGSCGYPENTVRVPESSNTLSLAVPSTRIAIFPLFDRANAHWVLIIALLERSSTGQIVSVQLYYFDSIARDPAIFRNQAVRGIQIYIQTVCLIAAALAGIEIDNSERDSVVHFHRTVDVLGGQDVLKGDSWSCGFFVLYYIYNAMLPLFDNEFPVDSTIEALKELMPSRARIPAREIASNVEDWE